MRLQNCYRDTGECLLHARKGRVFATCASPRRPLASFFLFDAPPPPPVADNLDLVVKWYACHKLDGRIVGEAQGRFLVKDFSSEHVTTSGEAREGVGEEATGVITTQGVWDYKKPGLTGEGAEQMKEQNPALKEKDLEADISEAERHVKAVVGDVAVEPLRARLAHLHSQLAHLATSREMAAASGSACPVADPTKVPELDFERKMRAERETAAMVKDIKAKMRNAKFLPLVDAVRARGVKNAEFRCMSLSDDDVPLVVAALPKKGREPGPGETALEVLDLSYNEITDVGVQELMFALAKGDAPQLKTFNLQRTKITPIGKKQLGGLRVLRKALAVLVDADDAE